MILMPLACLTSTILIFLLSGQKIEIVVSAYLLSFGISHFLYYISTFLIGILFMFLLSSETVADTPIDHSQPIYLFIYTITLILQLVFSVLLFRIKRFKNGFPFIFNKYTIVIALFFTGLILILVTWVNINAASEDTYNGYYLDIVGILIIGSGVCILIVRLIKNYQRMRIQQRSESTFEKMYYELKDEYDCLNEKYNQLDRDKSTALHNISSRIKAMEEAVEKGAATPEDIKNIENSWQGELDKFKEKKLLPLTKISGIDILFDYYAKQFSDDNIVFNLMLDGSIKYMVDNVIKQSQLETLITNHLNDARIAVNCSNNTYRHITAMIRPKNDYYEFTVFDSGIPFEVDTLVRLGTKRVTTHADTGGSGIGFETTFEIMREYNASLIISEQEESNIDFSKSVSVQFDGKNQYIIETYRPDDFQRGERYIIKGRRTSS